MKKLMRLLVSTMAISFFGSLSSAQAVVRACQVGDAPRTARNMWAVIARVRLPNSLALSPRVLVRVQVRRHRLGPNRRRRDPGRSRSRQLENLAIDVSGALQKRLVPQIARHIRGDAASFIETISRSSRRRPGRCRRLATI